MLNRESGSRQRLGRRASVLRKTKMWSSHSDMNDAIVTSAGAAGPLKSVMDSPGRLDEEHQLIAQYAARLAAEASGSTCAPADLSCRFDATKQQRELIVELENKNREILQEIRRLHAEDEQATQPALDKAAQTPLLLAELRHLRQRKDELERRIMALQGSRRELVVQLEGLAKQLKVPNSHCLPASSDASSTALRSVKSRSNGSTPMQTPEDMLSCMGAHLTSTADDGPEGKEMLCNGDNNLYVHFE